MFNWLRKIDDVVLGPPHKFETILAFVVVRLRLVFEEEADQGVHQEDLSKQPQPISHRPL
jgi:hypothetical protein